MPREGMEDASCTNEILYICEEGGGSSVPATEGEKMKFIFKILHTHAHTIENVYFLFFNDFCISLHL